MGAAAIPGRSRWRAAQTVFRQTLLGRSRAEVAQGLQDQVDVIGRRPPVDERGTESDLALPARRAGVDATVGQHRLADALIQVVQLRIGGTGRPVAEADY